MSTGTSGVNAANSAAIEVPRGLKGVVVTETEIGDVRGGEGFYHYRQYSAVDLARSRPVEDVWRLLIDGELPGSAAEVVYRAATFSTSGSTQVLSNSGFVGA